MFRREIAPAFDVGLDRRDAGEHRQGRAGAVRRAEVAATSRHLDARLSLIAKWYPGLVKEVRGRGLIRGLGFTDASLPGKVVELARERGVFFLTAGKDAVRLVPSLNVKKEEVDLAMDVLESCLHVVKEQ